MTPGHKSMGKLHKSIAAFKWAPPKVSNQWCSQMQNMEIWEILWKIEQIHWILWSETKWQIGGAHRMAVSQHFVSEMECTQSKISTWDIYLSNFYQLFPVRDQMKAQEGVKVKFACFKGIVDPTDFQVSWGTWLVHHNKSLTMDSLRSAATASRTHAIVRRFILIIIGLDLVIISGTMPCSWRRYEIMILLR